MVEQNGELFAVEKDQVLLKDQRRKEALMCLVKQLVTSEMQKMEINPEKALDCIWSAAHFAIKATPGEVKKVFEKVAQSILRSKQKVPRGHYPANMPLALACIIDRAVYLARRTNQGGITALEKALGPSLDSILLSRWQLGRVRGSQFLANLFLAWERLGYFEMCKKHLLVLLAFARPEGLPDPPHKEDGTGWYKVVARDPGEDKNTEPIASKERQKALGQLRVEAEKIEEPPSRRPEPRPHPETTEQFAEARERVMHAMGQMGLMPKEAPKDVKVMESASGPAKARPESQVSEPTKVVDEEEEALFGSAIYNSAVYEEEEIFGSPQEVEETPDPKPAAKETPREAETLPYDNLDATQQYASQESQDPHGGLAATQPYQDEPSPKRQRLSGESKMDP
eukprot:symbB.v1.2.027429.t1/scaffold2809.1/size69810/4